ncbi:hypothetical protein ECDEC6B_3363 [Escherichia coli DEC6B]|nr:hypothetical protein ECDEC6B_3363 [Escherichia coli DEC6B]
MKMVLAQDMLLIIVSHDTGDFTSMTTQTLLTVGHNKTIHNDLLFGCKNLILYMSVVITRLTGESAMFMCPE